MAQRRDWGQPQPGGQGFHRTAKAFGRKVNLLTTDLVTNNVVGMFKLPPFFMVLGMYGIAADLDGAAGLTLSIGEPGLANRFLSASTIGQAGGNLPAMAATGFQFMTYSDTEVQLLIAAGAATPQAGILECYLWGVGFA
jgi:hypothetical protein